MFNFFVEVVVPILVSVYVVCGCAISWFIFYYGLRGIDPFDKDDKPDE